MNAAFQDYLERLGPVYDPIIDGNEELPEFWCTLCDKLVKPGAGVVMDGDRVREYRFEHGHVPRPEWPEGMSPEDYHELEKSVHFYELLHTVTTFIVSERRWVFGCGTSENFGFPGGLLIPPGMFSPWRWEWNEEMRQMRAARDV